MIPPRSNPRLTGFLAACLVAVLSLGLASCLFEEEKTSYPALKKDELQGCWRQVDAGGAICQEACFDRDSLYYRKLDDGQAPPHVIEYSGSYHVQGPQFVGTRFSYRSTANSVTQEASLLHKMTIVRDTLLLLADRTDAPIEKYARSDSASSCGERWILFEKPPAWADN